MLSKDELKKLIIVLGRRWLFPDFTNKITWIVVATGCGVLLTPAPLTLIVYNWLVATINLNSGIPYTLAEFKSESPDNVWGVVLILSGLLHNIAYRYILYLSGNILTNSDVISSEDWAVVKQRVLENLKDDSRKLEELIPLLMDRSNTKTIDYAYKLDSSVEPLMDRLKHLTQNARSKIDKEVEIGKIRGWLKLREQTNKQLSLLARADYIENKASLIRASISELIKEYE